MSQCLVVMYHYVRDRHNGPESAIRGLDVATFEQQLDILCDTLKPIDWSTLVAWQTGRVSIDAPTFLLTFDDGLSDHAEVVAPVLEERGLRGVFFVSTAMLVDRVMATAHQIHLLLCHMDAEDLSTQVRQRAIDAGVNQEELLAADDDAHRRAYAYESADRAALKRLLTYGLPIELRNDIVASLFAENVGDSADYAARWYMNWEAIATMRRDGHTIGGHGHVHEPLLRLSPEDQQRDMARCVAVLRDGLGPGVRPFSYPFGSVDWDLARRCGACGFVNGFTTVRGWVGQRDHAHQLSRVDTIHVDSFLEKELACLRS